MTRTILSSFAIAALFASAATPAASQTLKMKQVFISSYQSGGSSGAAARKRIKSPTTAPRRAQPKAPTRRGLTGKQRVLGAGMLVPTVQGIVRAPSKKPDTSKDACTACD